MLFAFAASERMTQSQHLSDVLRAVHNAAWLDLIAVSPALAPFDTLRPNMCPRPLTKGSVYEYDTAFEKTPQ
eukprot:896407-Amphidinium_carterae.3